MSPTLGTHEGGLDTDSYVFLNEGGLDTDSYVFLNEGGLDTDSYVFLKSEITIEAKLIYIYILQGCSLAKNPSLLKFCSGLSAM